MIDLTPTVPVDPQAAGLNPAALERLRGALARLIGQRRIPGTVAAILRRGHVGFLDCQGALDPATGTPMRLDALFRIYSMTKPIVSVAVMQLFERGLLHLSDPIQKHLPEFAATRVGVVRAGGAIDLVAPQRPITVHDLLRHTAGLTYEFLAPAPVRRRYAEAKIFSLQRTNAEFSQALAALPLMHQPGSVWDYSRATDVLGRLVEVVAGRPLGEVLAEQIFAPLHMSDTAFSVPAAGHDRVAEPFVKDPDTGADVNLIDIRRPQPMQMGGGGLVSTLADYANFVQTLMAGGDFHGTRLLGRKTIEFMTSDHLGGIPSVSDLLPPGHGFGLGFAVRLADGMAPNPGSAGSYFWGGIAGTAFFVDPREEMCAIFMTQAPGQRDEIRGLFRNLVYAALDR